MTKNDVLTGYHVKVMMWFIGVLFSILITLIAYIWQDSKEQQSTFNETIKTSLTKHDQEIAEIKKYILMQGYDIDEKVDRSNWDQMNKDFQKKKNTRGGSTKTVPLYNSVNDVDAIYVASD